MYVGRLSHVCWTIIIAVEKEEYNPYISNKYTDGM